MKRVSLLALLAAIALWLRRQQTQTEDEEVVVASQGSLGRNAAVAGMGARAGGRWAVTQAQKTFASAERREELDREFEMKTTEDVVASLGNLKGAMMKVGQMASYLDLGLPENA